MRHRSWISIVLASLFLFAGAATASAAPGQSGAPLQPCIDYSRQEEAGRVEIDLRKDPRTGGFTTLTIFWVINDLGAAPGTYYWNHIVNGVVTSSPHFEVKDDNLHTAFRMSEGWKYGDRYKFQATHYSPATRTTYVATVNECLIVPRT